MDYISLCCCLVAFLLYYNTLDAGFVYDDRRAILSNPDLLPSTPWAKLLQDDFWGTPLSDSGSHGSYRPLCVLSFRLNYLLGGYQPWGYHLVNVLLHCLATVLLVRVARHVLPRSRHSSVGAGVAGLLFAAHPIHTEAVAGVVGRADLAACNLYLLSFLAYIAHIKYRDTLCCEACRLRNTEDATHDITNYHQHSHQHSFSEVNKLSAVNKRRICALVEGAEPCCWLKSVKSWTMLILSVLLSGAAMLSKETGITVLGLCLLFDILHSANINKRQWKSGLVILTAGALMMIARLQGPTPQFSTADNPTAKEPLVLTRLLTFLYLPVLNAGLLIFPGSLSFDWGMDAVPRVKRLSDVRVLYSLMFYATLGWLVKYSVSVWCRCRDDRGKCATVKPPRAARLGSPVAAAACGTCLRDFPESHSAACRTSNNNNNLPSAGCTCGGVSPRRQTAARRLPEIRMASPPPPSSGACTLLIALGLLALPFLPATNLFFYVGFVVAERVLYLPSAGLCVLFGYGASRLWRRRRYRLPLAGCLCVTLIAFSARTVLRNRDWTTEESLYRSAIPINPPKAYGNLGSVLNSQGRIAEAEWAYRKALEHRPNMADVHYNLGVLLQGKQQLNEAIESFQRAIHFRPSLALAYVNLGAALISAGRCTEAVAILRQGARVDGTGLKDRREHDAARVSALLQLGALYSDQGRLQRALATYREAAHSLPDHYPPQSVFNVLGETLARLQQNEEAERWYQAALNAQPDHVPAHITYGKLLAKNVSRLAEAEQWFRRAQRLAPDDPSVYHHYGEFLASRGRHKEAAGLYERAAELRPHDFELSVAAATAMRQAGRHQDAERWYRRAVSLKPTDARGHTNLGAILHLNGKYREAANSYREALRLQPNDVTTLTNLHRLHTVMT